MMMMMKLVEAIRRWWQWRKIKRAVVRAGENREKKVQFTTREQWKFGCGPARENVRR